MTGTPPVLPRPVHAVIFDMDGLLVDTESIFRDAMITEAAALGYDMPLSVFLQFVGLTPGAEAELIHANFGPDFPLEQWHKAVALRSREMRAAGVTLKAGVLELIEHLEDRGLPRAVATSSSHRTVEAHLGPSGIIPRFHTIVARGDYMRGKPHPDPYLTAASRLRIEPSNCLALEDSHNGVRAAHAAGMMTIMVPDLLEATEEMRGLCCTVAETLHDVRVLLA
jgi:HAD superfamily hydrolase (TIGR01509 family)